MDGPTEGVMVGAIQPDEVFAVTVTLVTPREPGQFIGYWHLEADNKIDEVKGGRTGKGIEGGGNKCYHCC